jgi:hypothetical protein
MEQSVTVKEDKKCRPTERVASWNNDELLLFVVAVAATLSCDSKSQVIEDVVG